MSESTSQAPLESVSAGELTHEQLLHIALDREPWATWMQSGGCLESAHLEMADLLRAAIAADRAHGGPRDLPPPVVEADPTPAAADGGCQGGAGE